MSEMDTPLKFVEICIDQNLPVTWRQLSSLRDRLSRMGWHVGIRFSAIYSYQGGDTVREGNWSEIQDKREKRGDIPGNGALAGDRLILIKMGDRYGYAQGYNLQLQEFETMEAAEAAIKAEWLDFMCG